MSLTAAQNEAVKARGNVLMVAGAGTGKTSTLVARVLNCLIEEKPAASLAEILMVTFTEAAAAEMRLRIRARLEEKKAEGHDRLRWAEELALFDTAHIGTLHSFCFQLVRQHFYELGLDPQLAVMADEESRLLAEETLDKVLNEHYSGKAAAAQAVQELIQSQGRGWDKPIRQLVMKLHHYAQTLRDPEGWMEAQLAMFRSKEPARWLEWLAEGVEEWRKRWLPVLEELRTENLKAAECLVLLNAVPHQPSRAQCAEVLEQIQAATKEWPRAKKTLWQKPLEGFFVEARFLGSLAGQGKTGDPLDEDWNWVRPQMAALLELAREFTKEFSDAKHELGAVDFHDLEQHALRLLWDSTTGQPTEIARQWRERLRFIFVDEYQDINEAQDAILKALSREGGEANRFLVGDVKQSIYRFRLADPRIFQEYIDAWGSGQGKAIPLVDNFRSRESILKFVNSVFGALMRREIGSVPYDKTAELKFGAPTERKVLALAEDATPRVELHLRLKGGGEAGESAGDAEGDTAGVELSNLEEAGKEARMLARRLRELKTAGHSVWDEKLKRMRPVEWGDMAVLLRSPSGKAESFAREFARLGVPLNVARGGFYNSGEITDMLSLLQLLDNPLQDLPVLAILRSPLVGMTLDELAAVRLMLPKGHFWMALQKYHHGDQAQSGWAKVDRFLKNYAKWRRMARQESLSRCLETVLGETYYEAWLLTQAAGEQRHANVRRLLELARQYDQFQRQGLYRFLRFIEAQREAETEPEAARIAAEDSVSLMSIHQSKGLEFPVVAVADLGKPFNLLDLHSAIILDSKYGLCPQIKPPHTGRRYPSLPYWLARQRQKQEMLGEEMRLLYVAFTRARDTLILSGNVAGKRFEKQWQGTGDLKTATLLKARSYLDWLAGWFVHAGGSMTSVEAGQNEWMTWTIYQDLDPRLLEGTDGGSKVAGTEEPDAMLDDKGWDKLRARLDWKYPHLAATTEPAKTSVSILRRRMAEDAGEEAKPRFRFQNPRKPSGAKDVMSAEDIGTAHHTFLEHVLLEKTAGVGELKEEVERLRTAGILQTKELPHLDLTAIAEFWQSAIGKKIREQAGYVKRELPFTARFSTHELDGIICSAETAHDEFVVVQGVADLVVILAKEMWLLDFKTDQFPLAMLDDKVKLYEPQVRIYAAALERIYRRPVKQMWLHFLSVRWTARIGE